MASQREAERSVALSLSERRKLTGPQGTPGGCWGSTGREMPHVGPCLGALSSPVDNVLGNSLTTQQTPFTHGYFLLTFRQIMFISLLDYERHTGRPVS